MLGCKMVTQTYRASKKKKNNPIIELVSGNYKLKTQLTNQPEIEIAQKLPIFHIPYFLQ